MTSIVRTGSLPLARLRELVSLHGPTLASGAGWRRPEDSVLPGQGTLPPSANTTRLADRGKCQAAEIPSMDTANLLPKLLHDGEQRSRRNRASGASGNGSSGRHEADRLKQEFMSLISHEFRTPLTSIKGYLELLRDKCAEHTADQDHKFLEAMGRNTHRLEQLVEDVLLATRARAGELPLEKQLVQLSELLAEKVEAARDEATARGVRLSLSADPGCECLADRGHLSRVFDALISNALTYTPEGGQVEIRAENQVGSLLVEVEDSGIGVSPAEQRRLFDPFFRGTGATSQVIDGIGMGLTIAKAIVAAHGGRIELESSNGLGSTFRVELPIQSRSDSGRRDVARSPWTDDAAFGVVTCAAAADTSRDGRSHADPSPSG